MLLLTACAPLAMGVFLLVMERLEAVLLPHAAVPPAEPVEPGGPPVAPAPPPDA